MISNYFIPQSSSGTFGQFVGDVQCKWLDIDNSEAKDNNPERKVQLTNNFAYQDPDGHLWSVPKQAIVDGASIPKLFWKLVGSPYVGNYRRASVIHDYFCCILGGHQKTAKEVHRMFYFACRAGRVSPLKAAIMYWAIHWFGPHWEDDHIYSSLTWYYLITPWRMLQSKDNQPPVSEAPIELIP